MSTDSIGQDESTRDETILPNNDSYVSPGEAW